MDSTQNTTDDMHRDQTASARMQNGMRDARTHVNRQKQRSDIEPPRTVTEQREELETVGEDGRRRRDPVKGAQLQHQHRDNGVGGAIIDKAASAPSFPDQDEVIFEKLPDRHEERARARDLER